MATIQNFDVNIPKDDLNNAVIQQLRLLGLKTGVYPKRLLKSSQILKVVANNGRVFHKPLNLMSSRIVQLQSGVEAEVPNFLQEVCCCIVQQADVEGLFRKGGSSARQKEIRALLDEGHKVQLSQHHVIDIANILKFFLRELPEPVLPFAYHDLFLHCLMLEDTVGAVLLVCLLLPRPHLYVLAYLMEFFQLISGLSESNKMTSSNLAIVITPSLMPLSDKMSVVQNPQKLNAHVRVVEILISNAGRIAVLPDGVVGKLSLTSSVSNVSIVSDDQGNGAAFSVKKRRRRSGSLTRMFNGLRKKIVGGKASPGVETDHSGVEEEVALVPPSSDITTPCVKAGKKRKALDTASAFSSKKKRDVLKALPQSAALADTPFKTNLTADVSQSIDTPRVCPHPNPTNSLKTKSKSPQKSKHHRFFACRTYSESDNRSVGSTSKKGLSGVSNFVIRKQKTRHDRHSTSGNFLERSWSAVSSSNWGRKKARQSEDRLSVLSTSTAYALVESDSSHDADIGIDLSQEDPFDTSSSDFVKVPKSEYEDLKSRMCAIESCISQEFSNVSTLETQASQTDTVLAVQNVYEKTLEDADISKDASADQLAKRLSRELKIRRSSECKVIRSPSARKIGSLRRRSKERQSPSLRRELRRNKSWHMMHRPVNTSLSSTVLCTDIPSAHCSRLRRGRPNTVFSGLPQPTPSRVTKEIKHEVTVSILGEGISPLNSASPVTRSVARRASSFHGSETSSPALPSSKKCRSQVNIAKAALLAHAQQKCKLNLEQDEKWHDAQELLNSSKDLLSGLPTTGRESIAKLRSENAGKVLATAKLFNRNTDSSKQTDLQRRHEAANIPEPLFPQDNSVNVQNTEKDKFIDNVILPERKSSTVPSGFPLSVASLPSRSVSKAVKKPNSDQSAVVSANWIKKRSKSSQSQSPVMRLAGSKVKKHSSMKMDRVAHSQPVKRNLSVPVQLLDTGKENKVEKCRSNAPQANWSPKVVKESNPLTERIQRISVSPLKDCNRISVQNNNSQILKYPHGAPSSTPNIKQPLTVHTPRRKAFTPQSTRSCSGNTPMKVLAASAITPLHTRHQLPTRLQYGIKSSVKLAKPCV